MLMWTLRLDSIWRTGFEDLAKIKRVEGERKKEREAQGGRSQQMQGLLADAQREWILRLKRFTQKIGDVGHGLAVLIRENFPYILANALLMKMGHIGGKSMTRAGIQDPLSLGIQKNGDLLELRELFPALVCSTALSIHSPSEISLL